MKIAKFLSIDGGGIRGIIPAMTAAHIEQQIGAPIATRVHGLVGCSTGAIVAASVAQAKPMPASDVVKFYREHGGAIFGDGGYGVTGPKYDPAPLEKALLEVFGTTRLSSVGVSTADFMAAAYALEGRAPWLFKSWKARGLDGGTPDDDFKLADVCRSTSAAPTFFPPSQIVSGAKKTYHLIDGGVCLNNPAMAAYVAARRLYPLADSVLIVSLGTGDLTKPYPYADAKDWGLAGWAQPLLDIMFQGVSESTAYELDQLAPSVKHIRLQASLEGANEAMDDASPGNLDNLAKCAARLLVTQKARIDEVIAALKEPLADRASLGYPKMGAPPIPKRPAWGKLILPLAVVQSAPMAKPPVGTTPAPQGPAQAAWRLGGTAAGAIAGGAVGGPLGALVGAVAGYLGGQKAEEIRSV